MFLSVLALALISDSSNFTVTPGSRIGPVYIGESIDSVRKTFGKPYRGEAAVGHFWNSWISKSGARLDVYAVRGVDDITGKVQVIRVTSPGFHLTGGLHTGETLAKCRRRFLLRRRESVGQGGSRVILWDNRRLGIAVESSGPIVSAIVVHLRGLRLNQLYLPYFDGPIWYGVHIPRR
jgi:hypothetical protein